MLSVTGQRMCQAAGSPGPAPAMGSDRPEAVPALEVNADRLDGTYEQGEKVVFAIRAATCPTNTLFRYQVSFDASMTSETILAGKASAGETVEVVGEKPGFFAITVSGGGLRALAGAAVSPLEIQASPRPPDFRAYWQGKLAELAAVPLNTRLKALPPPTAADYEYWNSKWPVFGDFPYRFANIDLFEAEAAALGEPARGYLAMPRGAAPRSLPAVLFTHGAGIGDADKLKPCAAARLGFLAMDINAHGLLLGQPRDYYQKVAADAKEQHGGFFKKGRLDKETLYLAEMYLRHRRALDVLRSRPEWDGKHLLVRGASQGGCLALACAGLDPQVTAICAGVPAFCDTAGNNTLRHYFVDPADDDATVARVKEAVSYVSVSGFSPESKADAYFTVGFLDSECYPASVYGAYNAYAGSKRIYDGVTVGHGGLPRSITYDGFARFLLEQAAARGATGTLSGRGDM